MFLKAPLSSGGSSGSGPTPCRSILIAEDNDDIRETLADALQIEGYRVLTARNGKEALSRLRRAEGPALVLLDLMMPIMNGWEFLDAQKMDATLAPNPVITISALSATASLQDPTPLDTVGNLTKPLSLKPLLDLVHRFCRPVDKG